jgi:DNA-binding LacI/PurR family transcriptional regulator
LAEFCGALEPGDMVPTHTELMRRLGASERAVRGALDELGRQGKIVRRNGAGTFIAERQIAPSHTETIVPATIANSRTIVAIGKPDRSFFDRAMSQLFSMVEAADLSLACRLIDPTTGSLPVPSHNAEHPLGYILFRQDLQPLAKKLHEAGCRVVLVGAPLADATHGVPTVYGDHQQGGYLATRHLIQLGHRQIVFHGDTHLRQTRRWRGHERAVREAVKAGLDVKTSVVTFDDVRGWESDLNQVRDYFKASDAPTAITSWNDHEAIPFMRLLNRAGFRVPEDISLVGYDNLPESQIAQPALTTVDGNLEQQLQAALDILTASVAPADTHTVVVMPTLICRDSSAHPAR